MDHQEEQEEARSWTAATVVYVHSTVGAPSANRRGPTGAAPDPRAQPRAFPHSRGVMLEHFL